MPPHDPAAWPSLRLGASACLLGYAVRYDGELRPNPLLTGELDHRVEWVPVCPEVELGLAVPRPTLRLVRTGGRVRMVMPATGQDLTARMEIWAAAKAETLAGLGIAGFVLRRRSPSCGLMGVRVYPADGPPEDDGRGLFALALRRRLPDLPLEDDERLDDPRVRERFLARVSVGYHRCPHDGGR